MKIFCFLILTFQISFAQNYKRCADSIFNAQDIGYQKKVNQLKLIDEIELKNKNFRVKNEGVYKIPVVIHLIHNNKNLTIGGNNNGNISREQILSQINVLNNDFRKKNGTSGFSSNPIAADTEIEFFLATKDPNGNPTTGINRIYTQDNSFNLFEDLDFISSLSYWDSKKYLNIWVVTLQSDYLGYGTLPYLPELDLDEVENEELDGVFIDHRNFGKSIGTSTFANDRSIYTFGRTLTHEVGHWLGLFHTWGDKFCGNDFVEDTPSTERSNQSKFCLDRFSNCSGIKTRNLIENYMDYTPDSCMNLFTNGQKVRMRKVIELFPNRRSVTLNGESMFLPKSNNLQAELFPNPVANQLFYKVLIPDNQPVEVKIFDNMGNFTIYKKRIESSNSFVDEIDVQNLISGLYFLQIVTQNDKKIIRFFKN